MIDKSVLSEWKEEYKKQYPHGQCQHKILGAFRCKEHCFVHPENGRLCVCEEHYEAIESGLIRVPPIRQNIDYQSIARKVWIIPDFPKTIKPLAEPLAAVKENHGKSQKEKGQE